MKIAKFQNSVKIALVDGFKWILCQLKALGLIFRIFFEFWIFVYFRMFYSTLNTGQIRIFENIVKSMIWSVFEKKVEHYTWCFLKFFSCKFFYHPCALKWLRHFFHICPSSKVTAPNVKSIFRFSDFCSKFLKEMREISQKSDIW